MASYNETVRVFKKLDLLKKENQTRRFELNFSKFSPEFVKVFQKDDYTLIYKTAMEKHDYDFILKDDSFFQFTYKDGDVEILRFCYYENPYKYLSYVDFLQTELDTSYEECGDDLLKDYQQYVSEAKIKDGVFPFRYDFDGELGNYKELLHPGSHIHIGHNNDIRLPTKQLLTPFGFSIFVLRNKYPYEYDQALKDSTIKSLILKEKSSFCEYNQELFSTLDETQLYFK